jgi:biopolymer transport protein TolQ
MSSPSFWTLMMHADGIVKSVLLLLLIASLFSWTLIFQRSFILKAMTKKTSDFEQAFRADSSYNPEESDKNCLLSHILCAGYGELDCLQSEYQIDRSAIMDNTQRAMDVAHTEMTQDLENNLSWLATIGSTAPYVGLLGTVWGVLTAFQALGTVAQASISLVAPGISQALVTTAIGLLTAIPAVIAYNRLTQKINALSMRAECFIETLMNQFHRQTYPKK